MKSKYIIALLILSAGSLVYAQDEQLTRQQYRLMVQDYSQQLKQTKLQTAASRAAEKVAFKGYLPKVDLNGDGTLNLRYLDSWNGPGPGMINVGQDGRTDMTYMPGTYHNYTFSAIITVAQPIYLGGAR